ncbi:MAG: hypothetical protein IJ764_02490 [Bacteroidales bacterium]|nr:hypothetical protein [Bacteroidales bacterium]
MFTSFYCHLQPFLLQSSSSVLLCEVMTLFSNGVCNDYAAIADVHIISGYGIP